MRRAHGVVRPALLAAAALLLSACGIPTTGVVESGEPGTGIRSTVTLYLFQDHGGLFAVPRDIPQPAGVEAAVNTLFDGPDEAERRAGLTSGLPKLTKDPRVRSEGAGVWIELDFDTRPQFEKTLKQLSGFSLNQLVCTAARARQAEAPDLGVVSVTITASLGTPESRWSTKGDSVVCAKAGLLPSSSR
ncbi:hypothetical protein ACKI1I_00140 [Streptomyces turgidiscabies]|uniref:Putative lipoprotein n=1 Tax=Streptomyces turgidiscabies (strain Car8) TaxID=698760 RepID=L7F9K8_STRT8|nr:MULTISPECIES: hypothetical protein [Streptomyces]ELP68278.1 putative lipoprotein [Streptomyces turgidiscabies Car8]MDX3492710.1 hypothetical protein [Streptomyces turgidiscabies]GAQ75685.1 sporulation and spore germination [Streptomyces turgidiscabies]